MQSKYYRRGPQAFALQRCIEFRSMHHLPLASYGMKGTLPTWVLGLNEELTAELCWVV